ncbi:MAG: hypothetical protein ABFC63_05955 [Thermoguttaceae bacterium]
MSFCTRRRLRYALAGCLLTAALAGCQFHRTERGFALRSQWSLECDGCPRLTIGSQKAPEPPQAKPSDVKAAVAAEPEVLPWRTRLKNRIAARVLGRNEPGSDSVSHRDHDSRQARSEIAAESVPLPPPPDEPNDHLPALHNGSSRCDRTPSVAEHRSPSVVTE